MFEDRLCRDADGVAQNDKLRKDALRRTGFGSRKERGFLAQADAFGNFGNGALPQIPLDPAQGSADFLIDVDIPPNSAPPGSPSVLTVQSRLQGIGVDLPSPFGKPRDSSRELAVRLPQGVPSYPSG